MNNLKIYETEIEAMAKQLVEKCIHNKIPMFVSFAVTDNGQSTEYKMMAVDGDSIDIPLANDHIKKHINVANGFETILPMQEEIFEEIEI